MQSMAERKPDLDDADYAAFAWGRYRRILGWMALAALGTAALAIAWMWWAKGPLPIHMIIGTALGVFFSVFLAAALMGLVFLSSGTGHDERIVDHSRDDEDEL